MILDDRAGFGVQNKNKVTYEECLNNFNELLTVVKEMDQSKFDFNQKDVGKVEIKTDKVEITGDCTDPNWIYIKKDVIEKGLNPDESNKVDHHYVTENRIDNSKVLDVKYEETGLCPNWGRDGKPHIYHTSHTKYLADLASRKLERTD